MLEIICARPTEKKYNLIYVCIEKKWIHKINREIARKRRDRKSERASERASNMCMSYIRIKYKIIWTSNNVMSVLVSERAQLFNICTMREYTYTHSTTGPSEYVWTMLKYTQHSCCENELMVSCKRSQMSDSMWFCGPFLFHLIQCLTMLSNKCNAIHERETKRNTLDRVCDVR